MKRSKRTPSTRRSRLGSPRAIHFQFMRPTNIRVVLHLGAALGAAFLTSASAGAASSTFGIFKEHLYAQTSASNPRSFTSTSYSFTIMGTGTGSLSIPGGSSVALPQPTVSNSSNILRSGFTSEAALQTTFPIGTYKLSLSNVPTLTYTLGAAAYPASIPQVTTGTWKNGLLVVDPATAVVLNFSTFSEYGSAGVGGHMEFQLNATTSTDNVSLSQRYATINLGSGTTTSATPLTSYTIPASTLVPGHVYQCGLNFDSVTSLDTTSISGGVSVTVESSTLVFYVVAMSPSAIPAPSVSGTLANQTGPIGSSVTFNPTVSFGSSMQPMNTSWFWTFNGSFINLDGVKYVLTPGGGLTVNNLAASDFGSYSLVVVTGGGLASSTEATLTLGAVSSSPPSITGQPNPQTVANGSTAVFRVVASGATSYQWLFNGNPLSEGNGISGSTTATLVVAGSTGANSGNYSCRAANPAGATVSNQAYLSTSSTNDIGRLVNISTRAQVGTGANILIAGFVVGGQGTVGSAPLLIRGSGPALVPFGVTGTLPDPQLQLYAGNSLVAMNGGWQGNAQVVSTASAVGAFTWGSTMSHDSALVVSPNAGAYTAQISGTAGDTGVSLVEVYDATPAGTYLPSMPRLVNISARVQVGTGGNILIAGFVIGGSTSRTILIRASGPALVPFGVTGTLPDPQLQLYAGNTLLSSNNGWGGKPEIINSAAAVGAFAWTNFSSNDSALLVTLSPGSYTAQVSGASNDTGVALVELYEVP